MLDGQTGFLVEPDNAAALAAAILRVLEDPGHAHALARAGQAHVRATHDLGRYVDALVALYRAAGAPP